MPIDERNRAMLHFACGVALGMDVRDLLQLESSLERQWEVEPSPEIEDMTAIGEALGDPANHFALLENDREEVRELDESLEHLTNQRRLSKAPREAELERQ